MFDDQEETSEVQEERVAECRRRGRQLTEKAVDAQNLQQIL